MGSAFIAFGEFILTFLTFRTVAKNINLSKTGAAAKNYNAKEAAKAAQKLKTDKALKNNKVNQLNENLSEFVPPIKSIKGLNVKNLPIKTGLAVGGTAYLYDKGGEVVDYLDANKNTLFYTATALLVVGIATKLLFKKRGK